ncbi:AAA family ATPase, partial [Solirubrobacter taibaiensis]|nr:AAA family ATPase [Solirubrobacter taibaiensis]
MRVPAEPLVGRGAELAALEEALGLPGFCAVEVAGEPGIGKTRLLAELAARADRRGGLVLSGSASELERDLPFGVWVDALDEYLHGLEPRRAAALPGELGHVFPALPAVGLVDRYRLHRAVGALLEELAPLTLVLDDVHWADPGSIELLGAVLRRPPDAPVLIAVGVRPRQLPERLGAALERAAMMRIQLGGLSLDEARSLVGSAAEGVYAASGGNPFYLRQLARAPSVGGDGAVELGGVEVPRAVAAALSSELALLSGGARSALAGAAVAGDPFELELAAAAADVEESQLVVALDELLAADLVRGTVVPRRFRFRHPLVRRAVYESTPAGWRLGAHERSATALAERGATAAERAHHVERSARSGDRAAAAVLREAADEMALRAPASAARLYAAALRLTPRDAGLLTALAETRMMVGAWQQAHAATLEGLALAPGDVPLTARCAALEQLLGRHQDAAARLEAALPAKDGFDAATLVLSLARNAFYAMDYAVMRDRGREALELARPLGHQGLMGSALGLMALSGALAGEIEEARAARAEAESLVDSLPDEALVRHLDLAVVGLAGAEILLDEPRAASRHIERGLAIAEASGQGAFLPTLFWAGTIRTMVGRLREAADLFDVAIETARVGGQDQGLAWNLFGRSFTAAALGDQATALATARECTKLLLAFERSFPNTGAGHALAAALLTDGDAAGAEAALLEAGGGDELPLIPGRWRADSLELLTRIRLADSRPEAAARSAALAQRWAEHLGLASAGALPDRAAA